MQYDADVTFAERHAVLLFVLTCLALAAGAAVKFLPLLQRVSDALPTR